MHSPSNFFRLLSRNVNGRITFLSPIQRSYSSVPATSPLIKARDIPAPHTGHIRVLTLDSFYNRNAISKQLLAELGHEIGRIRKEAGEEDQSVELKEGSQEEVQQQSKTRVLILSSALDKNFCSGADLIERNNMDRDETATFLTNLRTTLNTLSTLPIPSITAVSSVALGGGLELALASTFRVFSPTATVGLPETRLAIIPGAGGTYRLRQLIGPARASELCLTGRRISGQEAFDIGICERLADTARDVVHGDLRGVRTKTEQAAVDMALEICRGAPRSVGAVLRAVQEGMEVAESREYEGLMGTEDLDEALKAFVEKRKPVFQGR